MMATFPSVFLSSFVSGWSETAWASFKIVLLVPVGGIILWYFFIKKKKKVIIIGRVIIGTSEIKKKLNYMS